MADSGKSIASAHDLELVALATAGGRSAFGELVRRHSSAVRALIRRMGAQPSTADDVAQDAFLVAFEQIGEFRGEGTFLAWVKRIAARLYVKRWRREARAALIPVPVENDTPSGIIQGDAADRIDLDEALSELSPAERVCVSLCYGAGFSHSEAALTLKVPLGTVKSHVKRGMDQLRARMGSQVGVSEGEARGHG